MWQAEAWMLALQKYRAPLSSQGGLIIVIGGGPVGLLSALERVHSHNNRVLVVEKRTQPSRSQVVALREEMATFLFELMEKAKTTASLDDYRTVNELYVKHVPYNARRGKIITFQLLVLETLLRGLARIFQIEIKEGDVLSISENQEMIYATEDGEVHFQSYKFALDASGGRLQNKPAKEFKHDYLHPLHGTFELVTTDDAWKRLTRAPNMLEVALDTVRQRFSDSWTLDRRPITRVFPFRDIDGNSKVYIGTEIPHDEPGTPPYQQGLRFVGWLLQQNQVDVLDLTQTSAFRIDSLKYHDDAFDAETKTVKVGDAFFQPHYLTASGINNAYTQLTDLQFKDEDNLNESFANTRERYYKKIEKVLEDPRRAGSLFFQQRNESRLSSPHEYELLL